MKKFLAVLMAAVFMSSAAACGGTRVSSAVNAEKFYSQFSYPALLENCQSVADTETVYYPDGTTAVNTWYAEKNGDFYNLILNFDDGTQYFYNGNSYIDFNGKGLFYVIHFGWGFDDYQKYFLESDIVAPEETYTLLREGDTVTATFTAGDTAAYYEKWGVKASDTLKFTYTFDNAGRIKEYNKYCGDLLMVGRVFEYDAALEYPAEILNAAKGEGNLVYCTLHSGTDEAAETYSVPDGFKVYCGTGYDMYSDYECTTPFDWENTEITENTEISISYTSLSR